jgi:hypothetical protein
MSTVWKTRGTKRATKAYEAGLIFGRAVAITLFESTGCRRRDDTQRNFPEERI